MDTILNLIRLAGDYVSEEVWYRIIQIIINKQEVQGYAAKTCFEVCCYWCCYSYLYVRVQCHCLSIHYGMFIITCTVHITRFVIIIARISQLFHS